MNIERLQLKGLLAESKKTYRALDTEASGLILLLRSLLNPYEAIVLLDMDKIVSITPDMIDMAKLPDKFKKYAKETQNKFGDK